MYCYEIVQSLPHICIGAKKCVILQPISKKQLDCNDHTDMKKKIAYCGLDCEKCDAYIATKNNDHSLRIKTARLWSELNQTPILPEHINCEGCRADGVKTYYCSTLCAIRCCALEKGVDTCGDCLELEHCPTVGMLLAHNSEALKNLKGGK